MARLSPLPVAASLALVAPAQAESIGTRTCAKWLDGREHHLSTTMETWVHGYVTSSNQWALTLGLRVTPLPVPKVLSLLDQSCKSTPDARLADVLYVIPSELLRANRRDGEQGWRN